MEINSLMVLVCFMAGVSDVDAYDLRLTGKEGDNITITCSHSNAYSNTKYFCRGACDYKDVLITSEGPNTAKYHITDRGNDFDVTIYNLEEKDSGTYWCGIDRVGHDTYARFDLTVVKKPVEDNKEAKEEKTSSANMKNETPDADSETVEVKNKAEEERNLTDSPDDTGETPPSSKSVMYIGFGVRICFGLLVSVPVLVFVLRRRRSGASSGMNACSPV
ncbi:transmembrane domain-containing protein TMIGD3-like [Synchiropus splendidus]|uniref:transmembrane domain-containing protein TMIGD3-like n=1 Tax=Synchiropus splendidus TaxID=270530 RepID=UPI00237E7696|nr:transmembrane domain-containing protein TMIGD3-like [Synchiropus splendidus]